MDYFLQYCLITIIPATLLLVAFIFVHFKTSLSAPKKNLPPKVSDAWPIIGHLLKLAGKDLPHQVLGDMADKYGSAFTIQYGSHPALVIGDREMVKECFSSNNDKLFSNRASPLFHEIVLYSKDSFGFVTDGPFWREMRKLSMLHLLSNHRLELLKHSRKLEMDMCFKELYQIWSNSTTTTTTSIHNNINDKKQRPGTVLVEMNEWFEEVMLNVVARLVVGKRSFEIQGKATGSSEEGCREYNQYKKVWDEARRHMATLAVSDMIPFLWWIDHLSGLYSSMKRTAKKLDAILVSWLEEHRLRHHERRLLQLNVNRSYKVGDLEDEEMDFMDIMLLKMEDEGIQLFDHDLDTVIKSICLDMILGGGDTTTATLTWTLSLLLNNRDILNKARDELDLLVGKERQVEESDIKKLVYLQAIFKESLRLYPAAPLNGRVTMEDCNVGGFDIQAGTHLFVNIWKVQRDPSVWSDPSKFRPERFLEEQLNIDVRGQDFELIPFGAGRRICTGISYSLQVMHITLARLIHGFELVTPMDLDVDMTKTPGFFNYKATPLKVLIAPRFHSKLFGC